MVINYCDGPITIVSDVDKTFVLNLFTYTFLCIYLLNFCIRVLSSDTLNVKKSLRYLKKKRKKKDTNVWKNHVIVLCGCLSQ